jgi:hypothetical protein
VLFLPRHRCRPSFRIPPAAQDCGYNFVVPGKKPRIEYGVETDADFVQLSTEYFGIAEP